MPDNENTGAGQEQAQQAAQQAALEARETIRRGLAMVSNLVHSQQTAMGYWPEEDGTPIDYRTFFAELHSKVASAYETYKEERDPTHITWIDPKTGEEVEPGKGIPQGLATDLIEIVFDVLGFATNVGIHVGHLAADLAVSMGAPTEVVEGDDKGEDEGENEGENEEDDFDLAAILGNEVQGTPPSIEIETPAADKKPEGT